MNELAELITAHSGKVSISLTAESLLDIIKNTSNETAALMMDKLKPHERPLSEKVVCEQLGKTRQTIAKYRKEGKLRYHRIGREIYYYPSELKEDIKNF